MLHSAIEAPAGTRWRNAAEAKETPHAVTARPEREPCCLSKGVAHVSFSGGGIFLPARDPYDRQILMEHVTHHVGVGGEAQVLVDGQRWLVRLRSGHCSSCCFTCGCIPQPACYAAADGGAACCMQCAFGCTSEPLPTHHELRTRAT